MINGARELALRSLVRCEKEGRYSNIELGNTLDHAALSPEDRGLYTRLVYGVIERKLTLDHLLSVWSSRPIAELESATRCLLRMGLAQILYFDRIPDHAAVDETVELAKKYVKNAAGFCNAILRRAVREKNGWEGLLPEGNDAAALSVRYSFPAWMCRRFLLAFGEEKTASLLAAFNRLPAMTLRVNTLRTTREALLAELREQGISADPTAFSPYGIRLNAPVNGLAALWEGKCFVQDEASQLCVTALGARGGEEILDCCACPGGKSFGIGLEMQNEGKLLSCDLHENKLSLITKGADRMGLTLIETAAKDGGVREKAYVGRFDRILCDLPCSGLGVMAKKPDLRYKKEEEIDRLPAVQLRILRNVADYLKPGGRMVFSTCTILPTENESVLQAFLRERTDFRLCPFSLPGIAAPEGYCTLLPDTHGTDGFFISVLERKDAKC